MTENAGMMNNRWTQAHIDELSSSHLSISKGLTHFHDNQEQYYQALQQFISNQGTFVSQFNQALSIYQLDQVSSVEQTLVRLVHSLKNDAEQIGASILYSLAKVLEREVENNVFNDDLIADVDVALLDTIDTINTLVSSFNSANHQSLPVNISLQDCQEYLITTQQLLQQGDRGAGEYIQQILLYNISEQHLRALDSALQAIDNNDFDQALKLVNTVEF